MQVEVTLLGRFGLAADGRVVDDRSWSQRRSKDLVKLLALAPGHRLHGEQVIAALWPGLAPGAGRANLHKAAHFARRTLGAPEAVVLRHEMVALWPGADVVTDAERFQLSAEQALASGRAKDCEAAADGYGGDLLEDDRYEEWVLPHRERLRRLHLDLLRRAQRWEELIDAEPTDEEAHRALMRQHLDAGEPDAVARQFRRLSAALVELGVAPQPATVALYEEAVRDDAMVRSPAARSPLIGREDELRTAREVLERAACGEGGTLLVEGALGMGKTRFTLEVGDLASASGWTVARSVASATAPPYAPVAAAVQRLIRARPDLMTMLPEPTRRSLAPLSGPSTRLEVGGDAEPPELAGALAQLFSHAAGTGVAVLSIDDVHAADDATVRLLGGLADAVRFEPVLIVLAFRREEAPPALLGLRKSLLLRRACARLVLRPLAYPAATVLARRAASHEPTPGALQTIWRLAEGNPFFTEELAGSVEADGSVLTPESLAELVAHRLASLPTDVRRAVARVAIAGEPFSADHLAALAEVEDEEAHRLLRRACSCGVVVSDEGGYRLRHALIGEALARSVPAPERWWVHSRVADRLIAAEAPAAQVAHHLAAAGRRDTWGWFRRAAEEALAVAGFAEALRFADRGLEHAGGSDRSALLEVRADALHALGDPAAGPAYGAALAECPAPRVALVRLKRARACLAVGAVDAAERCVADLDGLDAGQQARLLLVKGLIAWYRDELDLAEELAARARAVALAEGSEFEATEVLGLEVMVAHSGGQRRLTSLSQWMEAYAAPGLASMALDPHLCVADYLLASDEPAGTIKAFAQRVAAATARCGAVRGQAFATLVLGEVELASDELDDAADHLAEAILLHRRVGSVAGEVLAIEGLAELALCREDTAETARLLDEAIAASRWSPMCSHLLIRAHATRVRSCAGKAAVDAVDQAEVVLARHRACPVCSARFLVAAATACVRAGGRARAQGYLSRLEALGGPTRRGRLGAAVIAARGEVTLAQGDHDAANRHFTDAAGRYEELGHYGDARRCRDRAEVAGDRALEHLGP